MIGRKTLNVREEDVYAHIAGYTIANDVSFRDLQTNVGAPSLTPLTGKI